MNRRDRAITCFRDDYNCSQAVLFALGPELGLPEDLCLKISSPFGGGMAMQQHVCGAVTGAYMAIGLAEGRGLDDPVEAKEDAYNTTMRFTEMFIERHGTIICRDLIKCDLRTERGREYARDNDLFEKVCERCVGNAVDIAVSLIEIPDESER